MLNRFRIDLENPSTRLFLAVGVLLLAAVMRLGLIASLPPGMDNDEAFHMLRAEEIVRGEQLPIYITGNNGNDPLEAYTAAIGFALVGTQAWAGRLMAAFVGILGVALTMRLGTEMFPRRSVGLIAGFILSTFLWHVYFSRFGSQPILAATAATGTFVALWRGARTGERRYFVLAGVSLCLGLYAYVAFRLFPIAILIAGLALLITHKQQRTSIWQGGVWSAITIVVTYAPAAWYFIRNPQWFFNRFGQTTEGMTLDSILTNAQKTIGGLFWLGDPDWRFNIPGRPALDVVQIVFFVVAMIVLVWRWRKPETWALLSWLAIGLVPAMLTVQAPHFGRTITTPPVLAIIVALGVATVWQLTKFRVARLVIAGSVIVSTLIPIWLYFGVWANDVRAYQSYDIQQADIARLLKAAPPGAALYATPLNVGWIHDYWTIEFLLGREALARYSPFNGTLCSVAATELPHGARYVIAATEADDLSRTPAMLQELFPNVARQVVDVRGERYSMVVYDVPAGTPAQIGDATRAQFGDIVKLKSYQLSSQTIEPNTPLKLNVVWQTIQPSAAPYKIFIHLYGAPKSDGSPVYAQMDGEPCARLWHTDKWRPGELLFDSYTIRTPTSLPPGNYSLAIGWYTETTGERLPVMGAGPDVTTLELARFSVR